MRRRLTTALVAAAIALAPAALQAQRSQFPWWETPITRDLNLSEQQQQQIEQILKESRAPFNDLRKEMEGADNELEARFNEDPVDANATRLAIERVVRARGEMTRAFSELSLRLRAVLTTEQWRELQRRLERGGGGRGAPRGDRGRGGPPKRDMR